MVQAHEKKPGYYRARASASLNRDMDYHDQLRIAQLEVLNFKLGSGLCAIVETEFHLISFPFED